MIDSDNKKPNIVSFKSSQKVPLGINQMEGS
jgi:hypothetical protein